MVVEPTSLVMAFAVSLGACLFFIGTQRWHIRHTTRGEDIRAVQAAHRAPTPRIGGVSVTLAMAVVLLFLVPEALRATTLYFAISCLPVFIAGLGEDLGLGVSPARRLLAGGLSALLAVLLLGEWVEPGGIPFIGALFSFPILAIALTLLWTTGLCHAFNLVDGVNGLAASIAIAVALALAVIAQTAGEPLLASVALMLAASFLGFFVCNWPFGKIFLGDGGAYTAGHVLGWLAILLAAQQPAFCTPAMVLLFFWPVADTLFAIYRRFVGDKPAYLPDRMHFHQVVMRGLEILLLGRARRSLANALTMPVLFPFFAAPILAGVLLWNQPHAAMLALLAFAVAFVATYLLLVRLLRQRGALPALGVNSLSGVAPAAEQRSARSRAYRSH